MDIKFTTALLITLFSVMFASNCVKGTTEPIVCSNSSDFATIVNCPAFVDKTLLIKTLFETTGAVLITAPRGFGKSTNMDMIKRFCEIDFDDKGAPKDVETTANYKLFKNNNLNISEDERILKEHFGKYPVMFIDYSPLREIDSFDDQLRSFRKIIGEAFSQCRYLLESDKLGRSDKAYIKEFVDPESNKMLDSNDIKFGLNRLSFYLYVHFHKKVVVLIDEYDAYIDSLMFKNNIDVEKMIVFFEQINHYLLASNDYIYLAMMAATIRVNTTGNPSLTGCINNVIHYRWLHDHPFSMYYGIMESEVDELLTKFFQNDEDRAKSKGIAKVYYNGYTLLGQDTSVYSWSLVRYLQNEKEAITSQQCGPDYWKRFMHVFSLPAVTVTLQSLLIGGERILDISEGRLAAHDIISLKDVFTSDTVTIRQMDLLYYFIFEQGHLSLCPGSYNHRMGMGTVKLANAEATLIFARMLKEIYVTQIDIPQERIDSVRDTVNSFSERALNDASFRDFSQSLNDLLKQSNFKARNKNDFPCLLFVLLKTEFPFVRNDVRNFKLDGRPGSDPATISLTNDRDVFIVIETDTVQTEDNASREKAAINAHKKLVGKNYINCLDRKSQSKVVYLGISCDTNRTVRVAYSYLYDEVGDLNYTRVIS